MAFFKEELFKVKGFIFDVDGVLSRDVSALDTNGEPIRTTNLKDGFAIRYALQKGYMVAIITGGRTENIRKRYEKLGVTHIYLSAIDKEESYKDLLLKTGLKPEEIMYMGDDLPDYQIMSEIGIPTCPADAVNEIKAISLYISDRNGGEGCVRDVVEQVMRAQGQWINAVVLHTSSF